jgi:hypothetical protein
VSGDRQICSDREKGWMVGHKMKYRKLVRKPTQTTITNHFSITRGKRKNSHFDQTKLFAIEQCFSCKIVTRHFLKTVGNQASEQLTSKKEYFAEK